MRGFREKEKMKTLFCLNTEILAVPNMVGLTHEALDGDNVICATTAMQARRIAASMSSQDNVFVVGCDDMEPVNLASAIVFDNASINTLLSVDRITGSISTRAQAAGIGEVITYDDLASRFRCAPIQSKPSKSGKHERIVIEPDPIQLFEDDIQEIDDALSISKKKSAGNKNCWIMSVYSGSGGVGKSTISALASNLLSALDKKILMIDCDLQFGDLDHIGGAVIKTEFENVQNDLDGLKSFASQEPQGRPFLIKAPEKLEDAELVGKNIENLLLTASEYFDGIVVNTGSSWSDIHAILLEISNCNLFLIDQRVSSVRSCQHALELASRMNIATHSFSFALNNCAKKSMLTGLDVMGAVNASKVYEIKNGGEKVEQYLSSGRIRDYLSEKSDMCISVFEMVADLCPLCKVESSIPQKKKPWSFR